MLLSSTLPLLPPPGNSLFPQFNAPPDDQIRGTHHSNPNHAAQRRHKSAFVRGPLMALSADENQLALRKLAISSYGFSWIKPAGCPKSMLGRREEELERQEVERHMREIEMQERVAHEANEMELQAERDDVGGDAAGVHERDLDDDVPEADDGQDGQDQWGDMSETGDHERDLDDEIPSAIEEDPSDVFSDNNSSPQNPSSPTRDEWVYDSRRAPTTPSDEQNPYADADADGTDAALRRIRAQARAQREAGYQRRPGAPGSDYGLDDERYALRDARDAEAVALAHDMLDEDELGEASFASQGQERDLDDSVPEANDSGEWEHTDSDHESNSEFEDQDEEMDISYIPTTQSVHQMQPTTITRQSPVTQLGRFNTHTATIPSTGTASARSNQRQTPTARVVSGNAAIPRSSAAMSTRSHQQRREGSAVSSSIASSGGVGPSSRNSSSLNNHRTRAGAGAGGGPNGPQVAPPPSASIGTASTRRGLRSQSQTTAHLLAAQQSQSQSQQSSSFETPTSMMMMGGGQHGMQMPGIGTLLGTDSSFGMGAGSATFDDTSAIMGMMTGGESDVDSMRRPGVHGGAQQRGQPAAPDSGTSVPAGQGGRRGWLNPSGARRNLFGLPSRAPASITGGNGGSSGGGLFTPEGLPSQSIPFPGNGRGTAGGPIGGGGGGGQRMVQFETPDQMLTDDGGSPEAGGGADTTGGEGASSGTPASRQTRSGRLLAGFGRRTGVAREGRRGGG